MSFVVHVRRRARSSSNRNPHLFIPSHWHSESESENETEPWNPRRSLSQSIRIRVYISRVRLQDRTFRLGVYRFESKSTASNTEYCVVSANPSPPVQTRVPTFCSQISADFGRPNFSDPGKNVFDMFAPETSIINNIIPSVFDYFTRLMSVSFSCIGWPLSSAWVRRILFYIIFKNRAGVLYRDLKYETKVECFRPDKVLTASFLPLNTLICQKVWKFMFSKPKKLTSSPPYKGTCVYHI